MSATGRQGLLRQTEVSSLRMATQELPECDSNTLKAVLENLSNHEFPTIECPPGLQKRASVALIIRVRPDYPDRSSDIQALESTSADPSTQLAAFFNQPWVRRGSAEILFIKRASRKGDRWTGHVALPGGRRDEEDKSDRDAAIRETLEEVGLDLTEDSGIYVGNLPQRVITTSWGKVPLMVLCPYVWILRDPAASQSLQPTEVAATHWVPIRLLLSPLLRSHERVDVSQRLAKQEFGIKRSLLRLMLGQMMFSAIRLLPTESHYSSIEAVAKPQRWHARSPTPPLLLWGLTLGVVTDFLDLIPPHDALALWNYPTFTAPDVRFLIWALSYAFRRRKQSEVQSGRLHSPAGIELGLDAINPNNDSGDDKPTSGISGVSVGSRAWMKARGQHGFNSSAIGTMVEGYYDILRQGVTVALVSRCTIVTCMIVLVGLKRRSFR